MLIFTEKLRKCGVDKMSFIDKLIRLKRRTECKNIIRKNAISVGNGTVINGVIFYKGKKGRLKIGQGTVINSGDYIIPVGFNELSSFWILDNGKISIGNSCGITNTAICSKASVKIGNHVIIGAGTKIYDTDFHSLDYIKRRDINNDNDRKSKPVVIKDDAFIGAGSIILKGSVIGERAIVGAGSVVCGEIPDGEVWAGNPARFIRKIQ